MVTSFVISRVYSCTWTDKSIPFCLDQKPTKKAISKDSVVVNILQPILEGPGTFTEQILLSTHYVSGSVMEIKNEQSRFGAFPHRGDWLFSRMGNYFIVKFILGGQNGIT